MPRSAAPVLLAAAALAACGALSSGDSPRARGGVGSITLPTGRRLDPAGRSMPVGNMPLGAAPAPGGRAVILSLNGWREQGIEVVDLAGRGVVQHLPQAGAFLGLVFTPDGKTLYASGAASELIYRYAWDGARAALADSISLRTAPGDSTPRFPAGLALSTDGRRLYVAENMADSLAVVDVATGRVTQRLPAGHYPYAVTASSAGYVYVSAWGAGTVAAFRPRPDGRLEGAGTIEVGRHPSALLLSADGARLFVASASTDRVAVVDTRSRALVTVLADSAPAGPSEGSTPDALALSSDGGRLFVAEADNNAVAVFDLSERTAARGTGRVRDTLTGRIPTSWYPTALAWAGDSLVIVSGKGRGTGPNPGGPIPGVALAKTDPRAYTLGQLDGTLGLVPARIGAAELSDLTRRVGAANGWTAGPSAAPRYPPLEHAILIIKENRTYDQVLGDLPNGDGDTSLVFFPRGVSPNHHALAERFGLFDRFFVNAEVSAQGHPWSTAAYVTDYIEKTAPLAYASKRPEVDEVGEVDLPAAGFLWTAALAKGLTVRNYGEYAVPAAGGSDGAPPRYTSNTPGLAALTSPDYPPFDMKIPDQRRVDAWIRELDGFAAKGTMPALEVLHLPADHTAGARPGLCAPRACMADNDLALGRLVEALSKSPFWKSTAVFVVEDDAQAGPDHVDSHRSVLLVISPWSRRGTVHRFVNTTDVLATIEEILGLRPLSQFDRYGRPLREIWRDAPDLRPWTPLVPAQRLDELNLADAPGARASLRLNLARADLIDDARFNRILWRAVKGGAAPYPGARRVSTLDLARGR